MTANTNVPEGEELAQLLCHAHLGGATDPRPLNAGKHSVTRMTTLEGDVVVKVHSASNGHVFNAERTVYSMLQGSGFVKEVLAASEPDSEPEFVITEFVEGESLLGLYQSQSLDEATLDRLAVFLRDFVVHCASLDPAPLLARQGGATQWGTMVEQLIDSMSAFLADAPDSEDLALAREYERLLRDYLNAHRDTLNEEEGVVIPVDLNFNNFLVTPEGRFVAIDLDAFLVGDGRMALGELMGHLHGTDLAGRLLQLEPFRAWATSDECAFYSMLCTFGFLTMAVQQGIPADEMRPWENPEPVTGLLASHREALQGRAHPHQ